MKIKSASNCQNCFTLPISLRKIKDTVSIRILVLFRRRLSELFFNLKQNDSIMSQRMLLCKLCILEFRHIFPKRRTIHSCYTREKDNLLLYLFFKFLKYNIVTSEEQQFIFPPNSPCKHVYQGRTTLQIQEKTGLAEH